MTNEWALGCSRRPYPPLAARGSPPRTRALLEVFVLSSRLLPQMNAVLLSQVWLQANAIPNSNRADAREEANGYVAEGSSCSKLSFLQFCNVPDSFQSWGQVSNSTETINKTIMIMKTVSKTLRNRLSALAIAGVVAAAGSALAVNHGSKDKPETPRIN